MPIEIHEITDAQLGQILSRHEGHFFDFKAKEIKPSKLTETISAFANAGGGEIYIGFAETKFALMPYEWDGFAKPEDANGHLQAFESLFPLGEDYLYNFLSHPKHTGYVLQVIVKKTKGIVKASDGVPRVRRGAQNLPQDTDEKLRILARNKGITSFEDEPVSIELEKVYNSVVTIKFILERVPTQDPEVWLKKNELIKNQKPTVAGVVLFADLPQAILPKRTGIKVYRYKTAATKGTRDT